jgi:RNA polymerase sigma factor for flagellar operon FliA
MRASAATVDRPQAAAAEALLWRRWRERGDAEARERLLELHLPYARVMAAMLYGRRFHDEVAFADYLQYASLGMLEALERFDPARGVQFRTFAARRMHGAILDGIERFTERQQQISARQRWRAERREAIKQAADGGGPPKGERLLQYMAEVGIGLALACMLEGTAMFDAGGRAEAIPFYRAAQLRETRERLLRLVDELPPQERRVVRSHYLQEMPFEQVAAALQLTKGRISQIHKQAMLRLRRALAGHDAFDLSL